MVRLTLNNLLLLTLLALFIGGSFFTPQAEAKVFSFKDDRVAGYIRGTYELSNAGKEAYENSSGTATKFSDGIGASFGTEVGFLFGLSPNTSMRAGFAAIRARNSDLEGVNSSGTKLMDVESDILALGPSATLEYLASNTGTSRLVFYVGALWADVKMKNTYSLTSAGSSTYSGATAAYVEESEAGLLSWHFGVGYETLSLIHISEPTRPY